MFQCQSISEFKPLQGSNYPLNIHDFGLMHCVRLDAELIWKLTVTCVKEGEDLKYKSSAR